MIIYKHELGIGRHGHIMEVNMTHPAKVIEVGLSRGEVCIWEQHEQVTDPEIKMRKFIVVGTGETFLVPEGFIYEYVGSTEYSLNGYKWHVYEIKRY